MLEKGPVVIRSLIDFLVTLAIIFESILFKSLLLHVYASLLTGRTVVWSTTTTAAAAAATQTSAAVFFFSSCSAADD